MYRTIDTKFWTDPAVRKLQPPAKLLMLYLITNPYAHVGGIYVLPNATICHDTGLKSEVIDALFDTLSRPKTELDSVGLVARNSELEQIWVVEMLKYQGKGQKIYRSVAKHLKTLHKSTLIHEFVGHYPILKRYYKDTLCDTPSRSRTELAQSGIQEQEQEDITSPNGEVPRARMAGNGVEQNAVKQADHPGRSRKPSGAHQELIGVFCRAWKAKYGADYKINGGKDGEHFRWLLNAVAGDGEQAARVVNAYLADDDEFFAKNRHSVGVLKSQFNRIRLDVNAPPRSELDPADAAMLAQLHGGEK